MSAMERRLPVNAPLRQTIHNIQAVHQDVKDAMDRVERHTIEWARQQDLQKTPEAQHAFRAMQVLFHSQAKVLNDAKQHMMGEVVGAPLISDEEMQALLGHPR